MGVLTTIAMGPGNWATKGGGRLHPPAPAYAEEAKMAKFGICEDCKQKYRLDVHHKDRNHSNNDPKNIQMLCRRCHGRQHGYEKSEGLIGAADLTYEIGNHKTTARLNAGFEMMSGVESENENEF